MTTVHIMRGIPGSGKSQIAKSLDALRFNLDDIRVGMGYTTRESWGDAKEAVALRTMIEGMKAAVQSGLDCTADNTHLVPRIPAMIRKELGPLGVTWVVHDLTDIPMDECIKRDAARENPVGEAVVRKMAKRLGSWRLTEEWLREGQYEAPEPYVPDHSLPKAIAVDIDGTVALHNDTRGHYEYEKVSSDLPNQTIIDLVTAVAEYENAELIFVSGREDRCYNDTADWLDKHVGSASWHTLLMRKTGDHRPDNVVKTEIFDASLRNQYDVLFTVDDRQRVVDAWRSLGLICLQVAPGDF